MSQHVKSSKQMVRTWMLSWQENRTPLPDRPQMLRELGLAPAEVPIVTADGVQNQSEFKKNGTHQKVA